MGGATRSLSGAFSLALLLSACTGGAVESGPSADEPPAATTTSAASASAPESEAAAVASVPLGGSTYRLDLETLGGEPRLALRQAVPVGRIADSVVTLVVGDDTVVATIVLEVVSSQADGSEQRLTAELTSIETENPTLQAGLDEGTGVRAVFVRDQRGAVAEWQPEIPDFLPSRTRAFVELLIEAPLAFAGPLPLESVGSGSRWAAGFDESSGTSERRYELLSWTGDGASSEYDVSFQAGLAEGRLSGTAADVVPAFQTFDTQLNSITVETTSR